MPNIAKPTGMSTIWATSGTKTAPTALKINQGWVVELPPYQTANYIENKQDQFNGHVNMHGLPQWDGETEYQGGVSYTKGSNGTIYKCLVTNINFDPINPLNSNLWSVAFEPFGSVLVVQAQLDAHLTNYETLAGLSSALAARNNLSVFSKAESDARFASIQGLATQTFMVGPATLPQHAVRRDQLDALVASATESSRGVAELATTAETQTGINDTDIVTPLKAGTVFLKKSDNLSTLASPTTARTNLGLGTIATEAASSFLRGSNNLSDVGNAATARTNLGITTTATQAESYFLRSAQNLADLQSAAAARQNLGLTSTATSTPETFVSNVSVVGQVAMFATTTAPTGWLLCNGSAVSRVTYAELFAAIGTTYGIGDGLTTFNVPNCIDEFPRGWNGNSGSVGTKFNQSIQSHTHTATTGADGGHTHTASTGSGGDHVHAASTTTNGDHTHSKTYTYVAGGALNLGFIYNDPNVYHGGGDSRSTAGNKTMTTSSNGAHAHTVNVGLGGLHTHTVSIVAAPAHTHTVAVQSTGSAETKPRGITFLFCIRH